MAFQVIADYDSINEVVKKIKKTTENYNDVVNAIYNKFSPVQSSNVWAGVDNSAYTNSFTSYIGELKHIGVVYETFLAYIEEIARRYKEIDEEYGTFTVFEPVEYDSPVDEEPIYELYDSPVDEEPIYEPGVTYTPLINTSPYESSIAPPKSSVNDPTGKSRWDNYKNKMQQEKRKPAGGN